LTKDSLQVERTNVLDKAEHRIFIIIVWKKYFSFSKHGFGKITRSKKKIRKNLLLSYFEK
jgi:hypothetical protein